MKYKLTEETKEFLGRKLHRIVCVTAFASVSVGDIGGWVESESNLSQEGNAWVYGDALVCGNAKVYGNAKVFGNAKVYGNAKVFGNAEVYGNAKVCDNAEVFGDAKVCDNAKVFGDAKVYGNAKVCGNAEVYGNAKVYGNAEVCDNAKVCYNAKVCGNAWVFGNAEVFGDAKVYGNADFIVLKNSWSSGRYFTYTASNKMWKVGCFYGSGKKLIEKAYEDSELSGKCYEATVKYVEEIERLKKELKNEH